MMPDFLGMILWPFRWAIEALLVGFHTVLRALGMGPADGWTWVLAITGLVLVVRAALKNWLMPVFTQFRSHELRIALQSSQFLR